MKWRKNMDQFKKKVENKGKRDKRIDETNRK